MIMNELSLNDSVKVSVAAVSDKDILLVSRFQLSFLCPCLRFSPAGEVPNKISNINLTLLANPLVLVHLVSALSR